MGKIFLMYSSVGISKGCTRPVTTQMEASVVQTTMCHRVSWGGKERMKCELRSLFLWELRMGAHVHTVMGK